ncbi:MAG: pectate lyase precursor [Deltaproteobacteria bacterium]|nr:pectate lyase precursor [Deltaproteobacteria bacterium]
MTKVPKTNFITFSKSNNFLLLLMLLFSASNVNAELSSFPGAEGFGAVSIGGRGGKVIKVTNLNSNGPGSLQAACETKGPRIVIFEVGGVIRGDVAIKHSHITIAGQTAPGPGITIEGRLLSRPEPWRRLNDIIVRFIRIRPPPTTGHAGDAVQMPDTERVILDHVSMSWANDEMIDICHSSEFTIQWCTIEESDTEGHGKGFAHNFGIISAYPNSGNISIHHNLFAHHSRRSPSLSPYVPGKPGDFRNNVIYNFHEGLTHDGHTPLAPINFISNYYKRGPSSDRIFPFEFHKKGKYYLEGNFIDGFGEFNNPWDRRLKFPPWIQASRHGKKLDRPADMAPVTTYMAQEAYRKVLAGAGCFPRDRVTTRTIREVMEGTGKWGRNAPPNPSDEWFLEGLVGGKVLKDSDGDGIPDAWEDARGLNKRDPNDYNRIMPSGYTAIEEYINDRAEILIGSRKGEKL